MEFDEMKKIWDLQTKEPLYVINERALHNRIQTKKKQALHITNFSELLLLVANGAAGCFILGLSYFKQNDTIGMYLLAAWMFITALYCLVGRIKRKQKQDNFHQSMHGDLDHAIATATYQVGLSYLMRWNIVPIGALVLLVVWEGGKSFWIALGILLFFILTYYASGWEHAFYGRRKRELEVLRSKLVNTESEERLT